MEINNPMFLVLISVVIFITAFVLGWFVSSKIGKNKISKAKEIAEGIISDAEKESKNLKRKVT